jgi:hypothetical protein
LRESKDQQESMPRIIVEGPVPFGDLKPSSHLHGIYVSDD